MDRPVAVEEFLRVCADMGEGFFAIPGTDTCLRISGVVRFDMSSEQRDPSAPNDDRFRMGALARVVFDARSRTEFGILRSVARFSTLTTGNGGGLVADRAFVQLGPLFAGLAPSFFDFYSNEFNILPIRGSDRVLGTIGWIQPIIPGVSLSVAVEDHVARRAFDGRGAGKPACPGVVGATPGPPDFGLCLFPGALGADYRRATFPNVVAALRAEGDWGAAQLSAALGDLRATGAGVNWRNSLGFGVQAGIRLNFDLGPMLRHAIIVQGAYAEGALSYLGVDTDGTGFSSIRYFNTPFPGSPIDVDDAYADPTTRRLERTRGWSALAALRAQVTSNVWATPYFSYLYVNQANVGKFDVSEYRSGLNLTWMPVRNLTLAAEAQFNQLYVNGERDTSYWSGVLRIQRSF